MDPNLWGPAAWKFLHFVTFAYPEQPTREQVMQYRVFFDHLQYTLPCPKCRRHYKEFIATRPPDCRNRETLVIWLFELHNTINQRNQKPILSFEDFIHQYQAILGGSNPMTHPFDTSSEYSFLTILMIVLLVAGALMIGITICKSKQST